MKALMHLIAILSLGFLISSKETADVYIKEGSHIYIQGSSNVKSFACNYTKTIAEDCQQITYDFSNQVYTLKNAELDLSSNAFDCGGRMINKDFNSLMESEEHPHIKITFEKIKAKNNCYEVTSKIVIAGETNRYKFEISSENQENYKGNLELNIEDYEMTAPRKLFGAIKVDPNIVINFDLLLDIK